MPEVGEDWSTHCCRLFKRPKGPCCFCGGQIMPTRPMTVFVTAPDRRRSHYDCAPGLGVEVIREAQDPPSA